MIEAEYHQHPALSQSGAKLLLPPNCPALYRWRMDNPPAPHKAVFDFGKAAHREVLGQGEPVRYIDAADWRTKFAQEAKVEAYEAGEIPLLVRDQGVIEGMVSALLKHPLASKLLDPATGNPEQSLFYTDPDSGVDLRGRLDFLPTSRGGRMIIPDYKTAASADTASFAKSAASYGYPSQAAWYMDLVTALGLADDVSFVFVVQSKDPPFLVNVIELDTDSIRIGRGLNRRAIHIFKKCQESGLWPGYSDDVEFTSLPVWWLREHGELAQ